MDREIQAKRAEAFKALHERSGIFAIPNPWDVGSAKMLAMLGFEALATTSAGLAFSLGKPDAEGAIDRDETLRQRPDHCRGNVVAGLGGLGDRYRSCMSRSMEFTDRS